MTTASNDYGVTTGIHVVKARKIKQVCWSLGLGVLVFGLLSSGLYFGISQVHWYVHVGSFYWPGFWLKQGWDSGMGIVGQHTWLINQGNWAAYRHPYRDIGLPALATMGALSIAGGARKPASRWYTAIAPILVLVSAVILITAATWLKLRFNSSPGVSSITAQQMNWLHLAESLFLGILIGQILHRIWRPAGTRIQSFIVERLVDSHFRRGGIGDPYWMRYELMPPTAIEAATKLIQEDELSGEADALRKEGHTSKSRTIYWVAALVCLVILSIDFVGFIGHFWVGVLGHNFPYLAP
jgi:hypothetical protein